MAKQRKLKRWRLMSIESEQLEAEIVKVNKEAELADASMQKVRKQM